MRVWADNRRPVGRRPRLFFRGSESCIAASRVCTREVLILTARGQRMREIGKTLGLSRKTVENHRHQIGKNIHAGRVVQLTLFAVRVGLVRP